MNLTDAQVLRIAGEAACDPRTVRKYAQDPTSVRGRVADRIARAMADRLQSGTLRGDINGSVPTTKREA